MNEFWIQSLGFVAFAINIMATSTVNDHRLRALICCSCLVFSVHYALLGAFVAGLNLLINSFRAFVSLKYKGTMVFVIFLLVQGILSSYFYTQPTDLLPAAASLLSCYALFMADGLKMRMAFFACTLLWMANAAVVGSYGGLLNDMFNAVMLCITMYRLVRVERLKQLTS
jgi:MFS family permease